MSADESYAKLKLFALNSNMPLAQKISDRVGIPLGKSSVKRFSDGEIQINIEESIRGAEVFVVQSISDPVNDTILELLIMIDALRRASASEINVVIPYYGYSRQDRKARSREPITAKLIATLLEKDRADRILTIDLHAAQIQGFFDIPVDHLLAAPLLASYFKDRGITDNLVVVSPDHAGVSRARKMAELLGAPIAIIDNRHPDDDNIVPDSIIGQVEGRIAIVIDDMIDTGTRFDVSAAALKAAGAAKIYGCATHAIFSQDAPEKLQNSALEKVIVTDTIAIPAAKQFEKLEQLSVGPLLGDAIKLVHAQQPVDSLFTPEI
ncbi:ribose-phosphate diphosphokinase [Lactobacillus sp.] [Lactiplantibacillus mudanjiangensis]|uniref:ribose-phosphate diphosphokinase n=1 Tax=Lactiplantibacillus mudanjiangensis TaxID=1296538 RepID=UPI0010145EEB|nr:ribose-phosphate diphosphokinase [Lactiplantibacillus mudanjiangensis]VDG20747.1 ribose-phosphate diphosphokinase [Lactobacillus sp.] [Lactiplantibacillus mudanjiangensis]VDG30575.1 ribose-phosphate diphosphokinase [Lactobacillus sp.] [Lactiplantibacillus mudanjiangensis]